MRINIYCGDEYLCVFSPDAIRVRKQDNGRYKYTFYKSKMAFFCETINKISTWLGTIDIEANSYGAEQVCS